MSLVPNYFQSEWYQPGRGLTSSDPEWPRIGIFCVGQQLRTVGDRGSVPASQRSHSASPWLCGSFELSSDLLEERAVFHWGWRNDFATGDHYLIPLGRRSRESGQTSRGSVSLVDDAPQRASDRKVLMNRMREALDAGRLEEAQALSVQDENEQARLRAKVALKCERCGERLEIRSEKAQGAMARIWAAGIREISIGDLRRALQIASR